MVEIGPVSIQLTAEGIEKITQTFASIEKRLAQMEAKTSASSKKRVSEEDKAAKEVVRVAEREAKRRQDIRDNSAKMAGKFAEKQANEEIRQAERSSRELARIAKRTADNQIRESGRIRRAGIGALGMGGIASRMVWGGLMLGGGIGVQQAFSHEMTISKEAAALSVASNLPGSRGPAISQQQAIDNARKISQKYNVDEAEVLKAQHNILRKSGDVGLALGSADFIAKVSKSQGVSQSELADLMGTMRYQNPNISQGQIETLILRSIGQGKLGGFEIGEGGGLAALKRSMGLAPLFSGNQAVNMGHLMALEQVAGKGGAVDPEAASVAVRRFAVEAAEKQKQFGALGIKTIDPQTGKVFDPAIILPQLIAKTQGNIGAMAKLLGPRALSLATGLIPTFDAAEKNKKGSGQQAVADMIAGIQRQQEENARVEQDLSEIRKSSAEKVDKAFKDLERELGTKLVPELVKLVPVLVALTPAFGKLLGFIADYPITALFAGLGFKVGAAIMGEIIKSKLETSLGAVSVAAGLASVALLAVAAAGEDALRRQKEAEEAGREQGEKDKDFMALMTKKKARGNQLTKEEVQQVELVKLRAMNAKILFRDWEAQSGASQTLTSVGDVFHLPGSQKTVEETTAAGRYAAQFDQSVKELLKAATMLQQAAKDGKTAPEPGPKPAAQPSGTNLPGQQH